MNNNYDMNCILLIQRRNYWDSRASGQRCIYNRVIDIILWIDHY